MRPQASCHPDRPHYAHGLCALCYKREGYASNPAWRERRAETGRDWWKRNRVKVLAQQRKRYAANLQFERDRAYGYRLASKYGIKMEHYIAMLEQQGRACFICGKKQQKNVRLSLDHCHKTGKNRALLCHRCNLTLGAVDDDSELLERMARYLRAYK